VVNITQAQLVARADAGQFTLTVTNGTSTVAGSDPLQQQYPTGTRYQARTLVAWSFRYRTRKIVSPGFVVPTGLSATAVQAALNAAWYAMDTVDFKMGTYSVPYNGLLGQPNAPQFVPGGPTTPGS
jgi:hypothetical protein